MTVMKVEIDDRNVQLRFSTMSKRVHDELLATIDKDRRILAEYVQSQKLSGQVLNVRSGRLRDSIESSVEDQGTRITGSAFASSDVPYARIHEYGGDIYPKIDKALRFVIDGKVIFAQHVRMPERSYLRSALRDMKARLIEDMKAAVRRGTGAP